MTCQRLFFRWATAGLGVAAFAAVLSAAVHCAAQDAAGDGSRRDKPDGSIREQDIYIPYTKLREVFEKQGRGVFLPYEQFQELWRAAREKTQPAAQPKPPAGGLITDIASEATVEKDVVRVKATLRIELLTEGWHSIPLRLADAGVIAATLAGKPARIVGDSAEGYRLLLEKKGKEAETVELRLEYAKAIARLPGMNSVSFEAPQSPVSRWRIAVPQAGVKVNLRPLIAATEVPPETQTSARRQVARRDRGAGVRRRCHRGAHRLDAEGRGRHRDGGLGQRAGPTTGLDRRRGAPHAGRAGLCNQPRRIAPTLDRRPRRSEDYQRLRRQRPRLVRQGRGGEAADHRRFVRAGQGVAASHRGTGAISARPGERRADRAGPEARSAWAGSREQSWWPCPKACGPKSPRARG